MDVSTEQMGFIWRSFYISTSYTRDNQIFYENFLIKVDGDKASCVIFSDPMLHEFITDDYFTVRRHFSKSFYEMGSSEERGLNQQLFYERESQFDRLYMKADPGFNQVPPAVYEKMNQRCSPEEVACFVRGMLKNQAPPPGEERKALDGIMNELYAREEAMKKWQNVSVFSQSGLKAFFHTGRFSDHMDFVPSFTKEEIRMTLEHLLETQRSSQSNFKFYIVDGEYLKDGYIFACYRGDGVEVTYDKPEYQQGRLKMIYIKNKTVTEALADFVESYIPLNRALSRQDAIAFLEELIAQC
jgi:hypothetical protein